MRNAGAPPPLYFLGSFSGAAPQGVCAAPGCLCEDASAVVYLCLLRLMTIYVCDEHMPAVKAWGTPRSHPFTFNAEENHEAHHVLAGKFVERTGRITSKIEY